MIIRLLAIVLFSFLLGLVFMSFCILTASGGRRCFFGLLVDAHFCILGMFLVCYL
jgi:hypothetical protein